MKFDDFKGGLADLQAKVLAEVERKEFVFDHKTAFLLRRRQKEAQTVPVT